jgi:hypothetical protein
MTGYISTGIILASKTGNTEKTIFIKMKESESTDTNNRIILCFDHHGDDVDLVCLLFAFSENGKKATVAKTTDNPIQA